MATPRTNVFIVDDHELIRAALRESLRTQSDLFIVGEAGSVKEALRRILLVAPDVALLDVRLPDGDGVELCGAIRAENPQVRCLMLSQESQEEIVTNAVLAGASGFLRKDIGVEGLVDAIRRVAAGESLLTFETLQATLLKLRGSGDEVSDGDEALTDFWTARQRAHAGHVRAGHGGAADGVGAAAQPGGADGRAGGVQVHAAPVVAEGRLVVVAAGRSRRPGLQFVVV